jgi:phosphoserine phosphatase
VSYNDRVGDALPIGEGKVEVLLDTVGRSPVLAVGDSMNDFALLENCEGLSLVVDRGDDELLERAAEHGWLVQSELTV